LCLEKEQNYYANSVYFISLQFLTDAIQKKDHDTLIKLRTKVEAITKTSRGSKTDEEYLKIIMKDYNHFTQKM
jgi:hypothetical protein